MIGNNTDDTWEIFGRDNPYYGVLGHEKFRKENLSENLKSEFFESGIDHINRILKLVSDKYGEMNAEKSALDFGCGVGRLIPPLSRHFSHVTGVDISLSMLSEAKINCNLQGLKNVTLVQSDDNLSRVSGLFDFVHTYIVLQHVPVKRGEVIIGRLLQLVRPGGVAALHMTFMRKASTLRKFVNSARKYFPPLSIAINLIQGSKWNEPFMQMNSYDINQVFKIFIEKGMEQIFVELIDTGGYMQAFFFARKPLEKN